MTQENQEVFSALKTISTLQELINFIESRSDDVSKEIVKISFEKILKLVKSLN